MKRLSVPLAAALIAASLAIVGCGQAAPVPTPTKAAAAPTKAAEPTKPAAVPTKAAAEPTKPAAAPQPTAAPPAKKVDFPQKGKAITFIVPYDAGGPTDVAARLLAVSMEKQLGTQVQVVNRPGAGSQVGITEMVRSKPDGYTLAYTVIPAAITVYLDPERKAIFGRKDIQPLAIHVVEPTIMRVRADSPFKEVKDVVDAGKANPEKVKISVTGVLGPPHLDMLQFQKMTGTRFALVTFDGSATSLTALLGGHIDVQVGMTSDTPTPQARNIGILDRERNKYMPDVRTFEEQGYKLYGGVIRAISLPAGVPKEVLDILTSATKKAMEDPEHVKKMDDMRQPVTFVGPEEFSKRWDEAEAQLRPAVEEYNKSKK